MSSTSSPRRQPRFRHPGWRRALVAGASLLIWAVVALPVAAVVFVNSSRTTVLATHEAVVRPSLDGWAVIDLGPFLPSFRYPSGTRIGATIELGKTSATSYEELMQRYAVIGGRPEGQIAKVTGVLQEMALHSFVVGALAGLAGPAVWLLLGAERRREIRGDLFLMVRVGALGAAGLGLLVVSAVRPWDEQADRIGVTSWQPIASALPDVPIPEEARPLEVDAGLLTQGTKRLVESALDSYRKSSTFYEAAAEEAATLEGRIRAAEEGETVAVMVSDRHDNILMDPVVRAVADVAGATVLLDAGDDTSTGSSWEAFSLESLAEAFEDYEHRFHVAGNHDHGDYIPEQAGRLGFTTPSGEVVEGPDGIRLLLVSDPRSSGLGSWRDETGLSFDDVEQRAADVACEADAQGDRVSTMLTHDANLGDLALERGCVDLVVGGHLHEVVGPDRVTGSEPDAEEVDPEDGDGEIGDGYGDGGVGYSYTTGTTGGAAYAIALGSKPRREATVSLVTYRDGRPVGVQWVSLSPLGGFDVGRYTSLDLER